MRAGAVLLLLAAANGPIQWSAMAKGQRLTWLNSVADRCKLPRRSFVIKGDELHFKPKPDAEFEAVDCALQKLRAMHAYNKIGFVTSERFPDQ